MIPYSVDAPCYGRDLGFVICSTTDLASRLTVGSIKDHDASITGAHRWLTPELLVGKLSIPPFLAEAIAARSDIYTEFAPPVTSGAAEWIID